MNASMQLDGVHDSGVQGARVSWLDVACAWLAVAALALLGLVI